MGDSEFFWITIMAVTSVWAGVAIVRVIVDGIVRTKEARAQIEKEYLGQMMVEIQEIKARLEALKQSRTDRTADTPVNPGVFELTDRVSSPN